MLRNVLADLLACNRFYDKRDAEDAMDALNGRQYDGRDLRITMDAGRPSRCVVCPFCSAPDPDWPNIYPIRIGLYRNISRYVWQIQQRFPDATSLFFLQL